ncbi:MAG: hypothetical protein WCP14_02200 [bacterium]
MGDTSVHKKASSIQELQMFLNPNFVARMRRIHTSDEEVLALFNRPFYGREDETLFERMTNGDEPNLQGFIWDATCNWPTVRTLQDLS